jgi:hypothetical protein
VQVALLPPIVAAVADTIAIVATVLAVAADTTGINPHSTQKIQVRLFSRTFFMSLN